MILLDTNVLLYAFEPDSPYFDWATETIAAAVAENGAAINAVTLAEICVGDADPPTVADRRRPDQNGRKEKRGHVILGGALVGASEEIDPGLGVALAAVSLGIGVVQQRSSKSCRLLGGGSWTLKALVPSAKGRAPLRRRPCGDG